MVSRPEIMAIELDTMLTGYMMAHLFQKILVLVGADEKGGREQPDAIFPGDPGGSVQTQLVTVSAALFLMSRYRAKEFLELISLIYHQGKFFHGGQRSHRLQPPLMLGEGMNVGIIPEGVDLKVPLPEVIDGVGGTGAAAAVQQNRVHGSKQSLL